MRITLKPGVLYSYCCEHDISRDELARRMSVSTGTAYRVDAGRTDPSPAFIAAFISTTGLTFEQAFEIIGQDVAA